MKHNLYLVQDSDRPMHVVAGDFGAAVARWEKAVRAENEGAIGPDDKVTPQCVQLVCEASELLLPAARIATDAEAEGCDVDSLRDALFARNNDVARLIKERDEMRAALVEVHEKLRIGTEEFGSQPCSMFSALLKMHGLGDPASGKEKL